MPMEGKKRDDGGLVSAGPEGRGWKIFEGNCLAAAAPALAPLVVSVD